MGLIMRAVSRKNVIAVIAGVLLAGAPLLAFDFWLGGLRDRQGQEEVDTSAKRAIALAESRVTKVVATLDGSGGARRRQLSAERHRGDAASRLRQHSGRERSPFSAPTGRRCAPISACRSASASCSRRSRSPGPTGTRSTSSSSKVASAWCGSAARSASVRTRSRRWCRPSCSCRKCRARAVRSAPMPTWQPLPGHRSMNVGERSGAASATYMATAISDKYGFETEISMPRGHDDRRPRRSAMARPVRHRRHCFDLGDFFDADAAARARQPGGRHRACVAGGRIRALLPADRRYPLRPVARRRSPGALA